MKASESEPLRVRLHAALSRAIKERDSVAVDAIRTTLGAIDNAEAVAAPLTSPQPTDGPIAGAVRGLGAADVTRRALSEDQIRAIVAAEAAEKRSVSRAYESRGQLADGARLRAQADLLEAELG
jgi:hypothetical protein